MCCARSQWLLCVRQAEWLADQIGAFEIHKSAFQTARKNADDLILRQMVPQLPIGWSDHGSNGPMTLIGMREYVVNAATSHMPRQCKCSRALRDCRWQDINVSVDFLLPVGEAAACVGSRVDQMWDFGSVVCVGVGGQWNLTLGGACSIPNVGGCVFVARQ